MSYELRAMSQKNPRLARSIIERMDPELIADQQTRKERGLPMEKNLLIIHPSEGTEFVPLAQRKTELKSLQ
ncbi:hypothetical protein A3A67_02600 [Candidatus Peribacteria bacterium RIFCSPLOWO2_01_FULL_51_18]|nr:MAG: hypothetical protein A3C52_00490 [Candidatus Peribacteria bacterium RIFCSPHIGHO2_02_FULL_51_15]OGJ66901.1 MAG: hypothetical protein A3A67_02600 [Candidatus Peribacteria bacterium RIFCSPLOWO2_01_FULL_51_18]